MIRPPLVILAGGQGTRLRSVTGPDLPKPMVDVFGKPFLYWLIKDYRSQGFTNITVSVSYQADKIKHYPWPTDWQLAFVTDGVVGGWSYPEHFYSESCVIVNGDTWIPEHIPEEAGPWILACQVIDAGAQRPGIGKIKVYPTPVFYDIGTPVGLDWFKQYFQAHILYQSELLKGIP